MAWHSAFGSPRGGSDEQSTIGGVERKAFEIRHLLAVETAQFTTWHVERLPGEENDGTQAGTTSCAQHCRRRANQGCVSGVESQGFDAGKEHARLGRSPGMGLSAQ